MKVAVPTLCEYPPLNHSLPNSRRTDRTTRNHRPNKLKGNKKKFNYRQKNKITNNYGEFISSSAKKFRPLSRRRFSSLEVINFHQQKTLARESEEEKHQNNNNNNAGENQFLLLY